MTEQTESKPKRIYREIPRSILDHLIAKNGGCVPSWLGPYAAALEGIQRQSTHLKTR